MGEVFESICMEYLWKENLPINTSTIGRWWGNNPLKKTEQEIDLIAVNSSNTKIIFCECKWRNEKMPKSVIDELIDKAAMFNCKTKFYYFFSKSGFTPAALDMAGDNIKLIKFSDMFQSKTSTSRLVKAGKR
jgi:hypothetical protein